MQGDGKVIGYLNRVLTLELTSINQYFLHARMFRNWGLEQLNDKSYSKSIKDMKQADAVIERILFLEGLPNLQHLEKVRIGEHTAEMLDCDLALQQQELTLLREAIECCEQARDFVSREVLEDILAYEEDHVDWIEAQQYLIENTGLENYLQAQI
ncbi:bacterioferritin [Seongchinamella sediminis]|uniref:Bacterioferritin n=1 Tax=Seongchinamella sediminis TaxID=2283635 RepID=A0A3L7E3D4_9GAMM|nr:bacterioferritin [Seongchinamella sediminis]RLQ23360.1 bacterioferritin [Seongchinamella sediminis]